MQPAVIFIQRPFDVVNRKVFFCGDESLVLVDAKNLSRGFVDPTRQTQNHKSFLF